MSALNPEDPSMCSVTNMVSKFRGCLIGGLIGDCLGAPFEGDRTIARSVLNNYMKKQLDETHKRKIKIN